MSRARAVSVSLLGVFGAGAAVYLFLPDRSRSAPTLDNASLSPSHFTRATLTSSEPSGPNTKLLALTVHRPPAQTHTPLAPIWSVFIKDNDIQVERPYTPLEGIDEHGRMLFWIKQYPKGEVGRWLHSKRVGDHVEFRGPLSTWAWKEDAWDEIVMISGGTGITPFYQLFHSSISKGHSKTRFTLLHSSPTPSELPPPEILGPLRAYAAENPERLGLHLFVDRRDGGIPADVPPLQVGRISKPEIRRCLGLNTPWWRNIFVKASNGPPRKVMFLVCGPEPMIAAIAGPYGRNFSQGEVGGVLGELGYTSSEVRKL